MTFSRQHLEIIAQSRPAGYLEAVLAHSRPCEDPGKVWLSPEDWRALRAKYSPFGLGDAVAAVAQPIAGALDKVLGTNLRGCGKCKERRAKLNRLIPNL